MRHCLGLTLLLAAVGCGGGGNGSANDGAGGSGTSTGGGPSTGGASSGGGPATGGMPGGGGSGASSTGGTSAGCSAPERTGEATFYDFADGSGNCSFDPTPNDLMVAAMNQVDYAGSAVCGACAHIRGPSGEVTVRIVDRCPECPEGDIDLSPEAFDRIAERRLGRVDISWHFVPCDVSGPVEYRFKEGSNQWWTAIQVRNHRHAIAELAYERDGTFVPVARENYNYFVESSGMGPGPYTLRLVDVHGNELVDRGIEHREAQLVAGAAQLPACAP